MGMPINSSDIEFIVECYQPDDKLDTSNPPKNKKILCRYCGSFHSEQKTKCSNCGANLIE